MWNDHLNFFASLTFLSKAIVFSTFSFSFWSLNPYLQSYLDCCTLDSQRKQWQATPVLLPRKSHGQRSLVGCNPWGREESDTTERLHFHFSLSHTGEWNGSPLQCSSCLENPRDDEAWWAAVYGVAQSRTQLKRRSSNQRFNYFDELKI